MDDVRTSDGRQGIDSFETVLENADIAVDTTITDDKSKAESVILNISAGVIGPNDEVQPLEAAPVSDSAPIAEAIISGGGQSEEATAYKGESASYDSIEAAAVDSLVNDEDDTPVILTNFSARGEDTRSAQTEDDDSGSTDISDVSHAETGMPVENVDEKSPRQVRKSLFGRLKDWVTGSERTQETEVAENLSDSYVEAADAPFATGMNGIIEDAPGLSEENPEPSPTVAFEDYLSSVSKEAEDEAAPIDDPEPNLELEPEAESEPDTSAPEDDVDLPQPEPSPSVPDYPVFPEIPVYHEDEKLAAVRSDAVFEPVDADRKKARGKGLRGMLDLIGQSRKEPNDAASASMADTGPEPEFPDSCYDPASATLFKEEGFLMDRKVVQPFQKDYDMPASPSEPRTEPRGKLPDRTVLDKSVAINGDLAIESPIELYGQVKGNVACRSSVFMGMRAIVEGNLSANNITIEGGIVKGDITCEEVVTISNNSVIEGSITANSADIDGKVTGNIIMAGNLFVGSSSVINGDITSAKLTVEPGAVINGRCSIRTEAQNIQ